MGNDEAEKRKEIEAKARRKMMTKIVAGIALLLVGAALATVFAILPSNEYKNTCQEIDKNLTIALNRVSTQETMLRQLDNNLLALQNQTQYITNKNMEFGTYICEEYGLLYYPNMETKTNEIICFNTLGNETVIELGVVKE